MESIRLPRDARRSDNTHEDSSMSFQPNSIGFYETCGILLVKATFDMHAGKFFVIK